MDDLVAQKLRADLDEATKQHMPAMVVTTDYLRATLDRIQALETSLAEAEGRVIAARRQALEEAAKACEAERLCEPQDDRDAAYDNAIDHCAQAIRALADPLLDRHSPSPPPVV